ncbi:MAG: hypothetical protein KDA96_12720 [Planctomycetaceae bacterium]|nr:hypothetical protein [Planctomycetaceae bacterium]
MIFKNDDPQNPTYLVIARSGDDESRFYERLVLEAKSDGEVASMRKFNLAKGSGLLSLPQKRGSQTIRNEILALSDDQESLRYRILERRSGRMRSESTTWQRLSKTERDLVTQHFAKERQRKRLEQERKERERQEALARARAARERSEDAFFNGLMLLGQLAVSLDDSAGGGSNGRKSGSDLKVLTVQLLDKAGKKPVDGFDPKVEIKDGFGVWQKYCTPDQHWGKFSVSVPDRCDEIRVTWRSESQIVSVRGKSSLELRFGN